MKKLQPLVCLGCGAELSIDPHNIFVCGSCGKKHMLVGTELSEVYRHETQGSHWLGVSGSPTTFILEPEE